MPVLVQRAANRQGASIEDDGIVFEADGVTDTSTTLHFDKAQYKRQAQDMARCRPDRGVSWVLVPSGFPPALTGYGCSAIMSGKVTMGIRQKRVRIVL